MASLWSQLFSCWAGAFAPPEDWKPPESSEPKQKQLQPPKESVKSKTKEGKVVITQTPNSPKNEPPQEYESTVEWECWDDDEDEPTDQDKEIEIPTISLPSSPIKATIVTGNSFDSVVNKKPRKEDEPEEDFFSDMEPEVVPAKKVFLEEKPKSTSSRIKMSLDVDEDIEIGGGWGDDDSDDKKSQFGATSGVDFDFDENDDIL